MNKMDFKTENKIKYQGITMANMSCTLFQNNYIKTQSDIKTFMSRWDKLQLSPLNGTCMIKMTVWLECYFLFQIILF